VSGGLPVRAAVGVALILAASACSVGQTTIPTPTIKIGVDLPLSGTEARAGATTVNGVRFFVTRHPVLDGFNVAVAARDDGGEAARGVQNVGALIGDPAVLAVIGPFDSSAARAEIPVANRAGLALVSPATSSRCLTKEPFLPPALNPARTAIACRAAGLPSPRDLRPSGVNDYFRLSTTDELQGAAAADFAASGLHLRRVAVVSDSEVYGQALADAFTARFNRLGGSVVVHGQVDTSKSSDLTAFIQAAKNDGAQGLYYGGTSAGHACALRKQMTGVFGASVEAPMIGGDGIALDPACVTDAGDGAAGIYATVPSADAAQVDSAQAVIKAFRTQFGRPGDLGPFTVAAYDATGVVYDALDRAIRAAGGKLPARDSVVAELNTTPQFSGALGSFGFDADGDSTLRIVTIYRAGGADPRVPWAWVEAVDYSKTLPY
jgi:branched-chain amino acid transport system substrate-binding protein